jgi:hypothetical protein
MASPTDGCDRHDADREVVEGTVVRMEMIAEPERLAAIFA